MTVTHLLLLQPFPPSLPSMHSLKQSPTEGQEDGVMVSNSWFLSLDPTRKEGSGAAEEPFL